MSTLRITLITLIGLSVAACGSDPAATFCDPSTVNQCSCSDGSFSTQSCLQDGSGFEACNCFIGAPSDSGAPLNDTSNLIDTNTPIADPGSPTPQPDSSPNTDTTAIIDPGSPPDPGMTPDTPTPPDASQPVDSAPTIDTAPPPDPCDGKTLCQSASQSSTCDGDELVLCTEDAQGCFVEERQDCTASDQFCVSSGPGASCVTPGETCDQPLVLGAGTYTFNNSDYESSFSQYFGCGITGGWAGDILIKVIVTPSTTLVVNVSSETIDVQAIISENCDDVQGDPLECSDTDDDAVETVSITNDTNSSKEYFVVADGYNFDDFGTLQVELQLFPIP